MQRKIGDVAITREGHVAVVEICRPPHNYFDVALIEDLATAFEAIDAEQDLRASVLAAQGKAFCAGANFNSGPSVLDKDDPEASNPLYTAAVRLFACAKPIVGAIHGTAAGGGLGLALVPDFRVTCPEARFTANFTKLGIHPGFGLTHTLPRLVGAQRASLMFYTGRRVGGEQALEWGLADVLATRAAVRDEALALATEMAGNAPLAVVATRKTLRQGLAEAVQAHSDHEDREQAWLSDTEDFKEGVRAVSERRSGKFQGR
ncbi:MAG: enoyl-CoA hydratase/isomerase family protein [Halioglobus sp.]|nr:enoyl-CoA hydratase/isomerase family protein [Halioglobus sp.]